LVVLLASTLIAPPTTFAAGSGTLEGRVVTPSGNPAPKAVWAATTATAKSPQRATVDPSGAFKLEAVPAGAVELAVETAEGLYVVDTPVTIAPGATRQVQLALRGRQGTTPNPPSSPAPPQPPPPKTGSLWDNPLTATLIVIGGAVVTGLIIDAVDDNDNDTNNAASPSNP
jgi:hypothetical protein